MTPSVRTVRIQDWRALERQIILNWKPPRRFVDLDRKDQAFVVARIAGQEFRKAEDDRRAERLLDTPKGRKVIAQAALEAMTKGRE